MTTPNSRIQELNIQKPVLATNDLNTVLKEAGNVAYPYHATEALIALAATLLDRVLSDNEAYRKIAVEEFRNQLELYEFALLSKIQDLEVGADGLKLDLYKFQGEKEYEATSLEARRAAHKNLSDNSEIMQALAEDTAINELNPALRSDPDYVAKIVATQKAKDVREGFGSIWGWQLRSATLPLVQKFVGSDQTSSPLLAGRFARLAAKLATSQRLKEIEPEIRGAEQRLKYLTLQERYMALQEDFRLKRLAVARVINDEKRKESFRPGGALNFTERKLSLENRARLDLGHAFSMLAAIQTGLTTIYDITLPFGVPQQGTSSTLDDAVRWLRTASNELSRFSLRDAAYTLPVSISKLTGQAPTLVSLLSTGKRVEFTVPESLFGGQCHVRVVGVSVVAVDDSKTWSPDCYHVVLVAPKKGTYKFLSGKQKPAVQACPPVHVARVRGMVEIPYSAYRDLEVTGQQAWRNISPIGTWSIQLFDGASVQLATRRGLSDIQLHLHLVVQTPEDLHS
jgi:hypothetical protein